VGKEEFFTFSSEKKNDQGCLGREEERVYLGEKERGSETRIGHRKRGPIIPFKRKKVGR